MHAGLVITPPSLRQVRSTLPSAHGGVSAAVSWKVGVVSTVSQIRRDSVPGETRGITSAR
jgi:hypothetical protein